MNRQESDYVIVGAGVAGAAAVEGIRELDPNGSILLIGGESHLPYDRPPLSKKLWSGKKEVKDIFVHDQAFYENNNVKVLLGKRVIAVNAKAKTVSISQDIPCQYKKLLLATGGLPQALPVTVGAYDDIFIYRTLDDYQRLRAEAQEGRSVVIIGGGFIGSELAASLCQNKLNVTMIYPSRWLCPRVFPESLGLAMEEIYRQRGIRIVKGERPVAIERQDARFITRTSGGQHIDSDLLVVGIGIQPYVELAELATLKTGDGIIVDEYLQTSNSDVYAAGDNAYFPCQALDQSLRMEHWDNARSQGHQAGRNMAGANEAFTYLPYFFSDLFEFGYEAVGEINPQLNILTDWQKENDTGVIYYNRNGKVRGVMLCNVWEKVDAARELIREGAVAAKGLLSFAA
jgi:3-phenylpropionate/trans-cinnamate dioxygenase ferredoxin reductase subunit